MRSTGVARLRARDDRDLVRVLLGAEDVLGEVQPRAGEPRRTRHRVRGEHRRVRRVRLDREELPDRRPESRQVVDRPPLQLVVAGKREPALALEPREVAPDLGLLADVRRRRPEDAGLVRRRHARRSTSRPVSHAARDVLRRLGDRGAEARDQLVHRPHRAVDGEVQRGHHLAGVRVDRSADRPEAVRELLVVHGDARLADLLQLLPERLRVRDRVRPARRELDPLDDRLGRSSGTKARIALPIAVQ